MTTRLLVQSKSRFDRKVSTHVNAVNAKVHEMIDARKAANNIERVNVKLLAYHDNVAPYLDEIRYHIDKLELIVDNEMWPLAKYENCVYTIIKHYKKKSRSLTSRDFFFYTGFDLAGINMK